LGLSGNGIQITALQPTEWPDACLGLPDAGEVCAQVVTPGYWGAVVANGLQYEFRANQEGNLVKLIPGAALSARQVLAQQLHVDLAAVIFVSFEWVEWPDACLGAAVEGKVCAQVLTPGYVVVLEAMGQRYEYHSDETGSTLRLAAAPSVEVPDATVNWTQESDERCQKAIFGSETVAFGSCGGTLVGGKYATPERAQAWVYFTQIYAPFAAETAAGKVEFAGYGQRTATSAEQRMVAEWARLAALEAAGGRSGASYGLAFAWHREGGLAGFCDDVTVYVTGDVYAVSCKGEQFKDLGRGRLTADQLRKLFSWVDTLRPFEVDQADPATADAMTIRFVFSGAGSGEATDTDKQAIQDLAAQLFATFSSVQETNVKYVLALTNVTMYNGPGLTYDAIGQVFDGQIALVTGVNADGGWWRVICPDDTVANCWVSADPQLTYPTTSPAPGGLRGGLLATFDAVGERFKVWVTNPQTIQQILDLEQGTGIANIPNGRILHGAGEGEHNVPWSWHLDPQDIEMAEFTMDVCDGIPSYVEEHIEEFVDTVGRYCPWSAKLVEVQDYR
jgi:hypothetical protein